MRTLPGQLSLFEVDGSGQPKSTRAKPARSPARVEVDEAVQIAHVGGARDSVTDRSRRNALPVSGVLLSPEDVARRCGLSRKAVYRAVARGELRAARILSRLRIDPGDVEAWLRANIVEPDDPTLAPTAARSPASTGLRRLLPGT